MIWELDLESNLPTRSGQLDAPLASVP